MIRINLVAAERPDNRLPGGAPWSSRTVTVAGTGILTVTSCLLVGVIKPRREVNARRL